MICVRVPVFDVDREGSRHLPLYQDDRGVYWRLAGYAPGCDRRIEGEYCTSCRSFMPHPVEGGKKKSTVSSRGSRAATDGKSAAAGE